MDKEKKKKIILKGYVFNRIERLGGREYNHIGFIDDEKTFGDKIASLVPKVGMKKRVRMIIELIKGK